MRARSERSIVIVHIEIFTNTGSIVLMLPTAADR